MQLKHSWHASIHNVKLSPTRKSLHTALHIPLWPTLYRFLKHFRTLLELLSTPPHRYWRLTRGLPVQEVQLIRTLRAVDTLCTTQKLAVGMGHGVYLRRRKNCLLHPVRSWMSPP